MRQRGGGGLASFLVPARFASSSSSCCSSRLVCARLLGVLSFNPTSGAPPFRFSLSPLCALNNLSLLLCCCYMLLVVKFLHLFFYSPEGVCMYMAWFDIGSLPSLCWAGCCSTPDHPLPIRERRRPSTTNGVESKRVVLGWKGAGNGHPQWGLRLVPWILRDPAFLTFVYSP